MLFNKTLIIEATACCKNLSLNWFKVKEEHTHKVLASATGSAANKASFAAQQLVLGCSELTTRCRYRGLCAVEQDINNRGNCLLQAPIAQLVASEGGKQAQSFNKCKRKCQQSFF